MQGVAQFRGVPLAPLRPALVGFPEIAQRRWLAWLRKQRLEAAAPADFASVLELVISFADPVIGDDPTMSSWSPLERAWSHKV